MKIPQKYLGAFILFEYIPVLVWAVLITLRIIELRSFITTLLEIYAFAHGISAIFIGVFLIKVEGFVE